MTKTIKIMAWVLAGVVGLFFTALIILANVIDPNDYKGQIIDVVKNKTGQELVFGGDLELSVFPTLGVKTGAIELRNPKGFKEKNSLSLSSAEASLSLLPLISGKISLGKVELDNAKFHFIRLKNGKTNIDGIVGSSAKTNDSKANKAPAKSESKSKSTSDLNISVGEVKIVNANIIWEDRLNNNLKSIENCDALIDGYAADKPFNVKLKVKVSSSKPQISADINTSGDVLLSKDFKNAGVRNLDIKVIAEGSDIPEGKAELSITGNGAVNLLKGSASAKDLAIDLLGMHLKTSFNVERVGTDKMQFSGDLNIPEFNLRKLMDDAGCKYVPNSSDAFKKVGLDLKAKGTAKSLIVDTLSLKLDKTTLIGNADLITGRKEQVILSLFADYLNLDDYLPKASESKSKAESKKTNNKVADKSSAKDQPIFNLEYLRKLKLKADLKVKELIIGKAKLSDIVIKGRGQNGVVSFDPVSVNVANGLVSSAVNIDARSNSPQIKTDLKVQKIDLANLSEQTTGKKKYAGLVNLAADVNGRGNTRKALRSSLNGDLSFKVSDGYVSGFDILYLAGDAFSVLTGGGKDRKDGKKTAFGEVFATAKIKDGVAHNSDFILKSPLLRAKGKGQLDFKSMDLNYGLDAKIVGSSEGQGGSSQDELVGLTIPLTITGKVTDPSIMVDLPKFAVILVKSGFNVAGDVAGGVGNALKSIGGIITEGAKESPKAVEKIGQGLKNLFN